MSWINLYIIDFFSQKLQLENKLPFFFLAEMERLQKSINVFQSYIQTNNVLGIL